MNQPIEQDKLVEEMWRTYMTEGRVPDFAEPVWFEAKWLRPVIKRLPSDPRCKVCQMPFEGLGGRFSRLLDVKPSKLNPQMCNLCELAAERFQGGTEIELSMLFADVRGSSVLAEKTSPAQFGELINRFYKATTRVLFSHNAMIEKLIGDEVAGFFVPGFSGEDHALDAINAARHILEVTGHNDPDGPWIPVGIGVHTGITFVGAVTSAEGVADITILGDSANTAARLASLAGTGEIIVSEAASKKAHLDTADLEKRHLTLKGKENPVDVCVITL